MAAEKDEIVLSFHDSLLRRSDVELLQEGRWLNDKLIGFMFEYFEREQFKDISKDVLFVSPDVTQFLKLGQGPELALFLEPLNLPCRQLLFFAVNDNESRVSTGGLHWSLLMYSRVTSKFYHYDSYGSNNATAARELCGNVQAFLGAKETPPFTEPVCPQQQNSSDCGVFVVCLTEHLCRQHCLGDRVPLNEIVTQSRVSLKRGYIRDLINKLGKRREGPS